MSGAISMRARLVEAFRGPWLPLEEDFHDPGVALDFVTSLEPSLGPTVVVVRSRLLRSGHAGVAGEWLCEAGSAALKAPNDLSHLWEYDLPSISRYRSGSAQIDLWESASPAAMLWAAGSIDGLRRASLDAAVACANLTLPLIRSYGRARAREAETAIDEAVRYMAGGGDPERLANAAGAADTEYRRLRGARLRETAADREARMAASLSAAACASFALGVLGDLTPWEQPRTNLVLGAKRATESLYYGAGGISDEAAAEYANEAVAAAVRSKIDSLRFMRAVVSG